MKIIVETDDGKTITYNDVSNAYVSVHLTETVMDGEELLRVRAIHSSSWGDLREIVKEVQQSVVEMQDILKESNRGSSSERHLRMALDGGLDPIRMVPRDKP